MLNKEPQKYRVKRPRSGLHFDLNNNQATKELVNYMKWWLKVHPIDEDKKN